MFTNAKTIEYQPFLAEHDFDLDYMLKTLDRTPRILNSLLKGQPSNIVHRNEGGDTWSPCEVLAHMIQGERRDWIRRVGIIVNKIGNRKFEAFNLGGHKEYLAHHNSIEQLLHEFEALRRKNLWTLYNFQIDDDKLAWTGFHPEIGEVTLQNLLSTWVCHDLSHLSQISRVMARNYTGLVGPWYEKMTILHQ